MTNQKACVLMFTGFAALALTGCDKRKITYDATFTRSNGVASDPVNSAESAAPASVARKASIVTVGPGGRMAIVREGSNGWTCMPDAPDTPGPDPMCFDSNAGKWVVAWVHHRPPPAGAVGVMYMLEGGTDASNTDPFADKPSGQNNWVNTGPHIMIVGSKDILSGYPAGAKPDTSGPYVMWAGTPYAHLMVPVKQG
ncbi:hypothetical protein ACUXST_000112 [Sphingomonas sp. F9_3S_D5_B_2]